MWFQKMNHLDSEYLGFTDPLAGAPQEFSDLSQIPKTLPDCSFGSLFCIAQKCKGRKYKNELGELGTTSKELTFRCEVESFRNNNMEVLIFLLKQKGLGYSRFDQEYVSDPCCGVKTL